MAPGEGLRCSSGPGLVRLPVPGESSPSALGRLRTPDSANAQVSSRTRLPHLRVRPGTCAFAKNGEVSGPLAQYHPLDGASAPLLITAPAVGQRLRSSPDGAGSATGSGRGDEDPAAMAQVGARADLRSDMASAATEPRTVEPGAGLRNASPTRRNPPRLAPCEPSATESAPARAVRAQRDRIRLSAIRAIPPRTMRAQMTSPERLLRGRRRGSRPPFGDAVPNRLPPGAARADGQRAGSRVASLES